MYEAFAVVRGRNKKLILAVRTAGLGLNCRVCTAEQQIERGCEKDSPIPEMWALRDYGWSSQRCPVKVITRQSLQYLRAWKWAGRGVMPNGGGWLDESSKLLDAIDIIAAEKAKLEAEAMKR